MKRVRDVTEERFEIVYLFFIKEKGLSESVKSSEDPKSLFLRDTGGKKLDRRNIRSDGAILPGL